MNSGAGKRCYIYDIPNNKAASDEIEAGVLQVGKI